MNRRRFLGLTLTGLPALFLPWSLARPLAAPQAGLTDPEHLFVGEGLNYDITFFWFDRIGTISTTFQRLTRGRGYVARAEGQTLGVIGFLTRHRRDRYRAFMTYDPAAGRLVSHRFEEEVLIGQELYRAVRIFDHQAQEITFLKPKSDGGIKKRLEKMPSPLTTDYLTAFYNFRAGVYGPPAPGRRVVIPTIPNQGNQEIIVTFLGAKETEARRRRDESGWPYYVRVKIDPKLVRSKKGHIHGWLSANQIPQEGVIRQVSIFGNIKGWLTSRSRLAEETDIGPMVPVKIEEPPPAKLR